MEEKFTNLPEVLEVADIKEFLNIGKRQAYELVNSGVFPIVRVGRSIKVSKYVLIEWFEGKESTSSPDKGVM
jgi:excisionase family DNA binding protein